MKLFLDKEELILSDFEDCIPTVLLAVAFSSVEVVRYMLKDPRVTLKYHYHFMKSVSCQSLLNQACAFGRPDMVDLLFSLYSDVELGAYDVNDCGFTCLTYAVNRGMIPVIWALRKQSNVYPKLLDVSLKQKFAVTEDLVFTDAIVQAGQVNAMREIIRDFQSDESLKKIMIFIVSRSKNHFHELFSCAFTQRAHLT